MSDVEELRKVLDILITADGLRDDEVRHKFQMAVMDTLTSQGKDQAAQVAYPSDHPDPGKMIDFPATPYYSSRESSSKKDRAPVILSVKGGKVTNFKRVYDAVALMASRDNPMSVADLEDVVDSDLKGCLAKNLSRMHSRGLLRRVKSYDQDRAGRSMSIYKYYIDSRQDTIDDLLLGEGTPKTP